MRCDALALYIEKTIMRHTRCRCSRHPIAARRCRLCRAEEDAESRDRRGGDSGSREGERPRGHVSAFTPFSPSLRSPLGSPARRRRALSSVLTHRPESPTCLLHSHGEKDKDRGSPPLLLPASPSPLPRYRPPLRRPSAVPVLGRVRLVYIALSGSRLRSEYFSAAAAALTHVVADTTSSFELIEAAAPPDRVPPTDSWPTGSPRQRIRLLLPQDLRPPLRPGCHAARAAYLSR
jgi:hypothetical protein